MMKKILPLVAITNPEIYRSWNHLIAPVSWLSLLKRAEKNSVLHSACQAAVRFAHLCIEEHQGAQHAWQQVLEESPLTLEEQTKTQHIVKSYWRSYNVDKLGKLPF